MSPPTAGPASKPQDVATNHDPQSDARREFLVVTTTAAAATMAPWPIGVEDVPVIAQRSDTMSLRLTINGVAKSLKVDPRQSLLDVLRETLELTGTKKGCNQGACGACTILLDGRRIVSCLTLAAMHDGASITTIEGLAQGEKLHPLQEAFIEHEGFQCGYCTAGQIMSAVACIAEGHAGSPGEIRFWMSGNICRCGAYPGIVAAVADAAKRG